MRPEWLKDYGDFQRLEIVQERLADMKLILGEHVEPDNVDKSYFERCEFILINPRRVSFLSCDFRNCSFQPKMKVQCSWDKNRWYDCTFHGKYLSTHFGLINTTFPDNRYEGLAVSGCDFSQATMHFCFFNRTDVASIKFPPWPCFTILQPGKHRLVWQDVPLPLPPWLLKSWFSETDRNDAAVFHWPTIAKEKNVKADPEEIKAIFASLDFVRV